MGKRPVSLLAKSGFGRTGGSHLTQLRGIRFFKGPNATDPKGNLTLSELAYLT